MKFKVLLSIATLVSAMVHVPSFAADPHAGHTMVDQEGTTVSESNAAFEAANAKMHQDMSVVLTGDADRDLLAGMIPHHQGAIEMAEVQLKYGKNPKVRKLARDIIKAQKREIAAMRAWLAAMK